jgi:Holliday junction resolvase RusA-like endonuclease
VFVSVAVDLDNLAKPVLDALKGVVFQDDGQISDMRMRKREFGRIMRIERPVASALGCLRSR